MKIFGEIFPSNHIIFRHLM